MRAASGFGLDCSTFYKQNVSMLAELTITVTGRLKARQRRPDTRRARHHRTCHPCAIGALRSSRQSLAWPWDLVAIQSSRNIVPLSLVWQMAQGHAKSRTDLDWIKIGEYVSLTFSRVHTQFCFSLTFSRLAAQFCFSLTFSRLAAQFCWSI